MIGWINPEGESFGGLISYIESGKGGRHPGRVAWMEFYNLPTCKPRVAACYMAATGRSSISCTRTPVYHFSVSFAPDDPVDEAMMRRVARRTLRDMGLEEYECAVFAHRDRSHVHLHFVVCRVHPVRRTLWRNWRDRTRLEYSLRAQEVEFGLQVVPGWLAPVPVAVGRARDGLAQDQQPEARWLKPRPASRRGDSAFLYDVTERAAPVLAQARSWAELECGLAEQGLSLRVKGGGFRITDGKHQVKASEVGRGFSRYHLEKRLGGYPDYRARMAVAAIAPTLPPSLVQPEGLTQQQAPRSPAVPVQAPAQAPVRQQEQAAPSSLPPSTAPAEAPGPELHVRSGRRPQFGDTGHGIAELFGYTQPLERERPGTVEERVPAPQPSLDQPLVPSLAMPAGAGLSGDAPAEDMPEPTREPAPELTVQEPQAQPAEPRVVVPAEPPAPARTKRRQVEFLKEVKERATTVLERAGSWAELERGLVDLGLSLRVKGGGFTVTDGDLEVKASDVGRGFSRFHLEKRLGRYQDSPASTGAPGTLPAPTPAVQLDALAPQPKLLPLPASTAQEAEPPSAPRFSLFEDEGVFGVYDSAVPQVFFAETRERALTEVERANAIVALYPRVISMGHLREMDGAWRDARGLPRLPEPEGERMVVPAPEGLGTDLPVPAPAARVQPETSASEVAGASERPSPARPPEQDSVAARTPERPIQPPEGRPVEAPAPVQQPLPPEQAPAHLSVRRVGEAPTLRPTKPIPPVRPPARPVEPVVPIRKRVRPLTNRERYRDVLRAFKAELAALYRDPRAARRAFAASLDEISPEAVARTLESNPGRYGRLRLGADVRRAAEAARWAELYAQAQVEGTRAYARYAARLFRRAEAIEEADRVLSEAKKEDYLVSGGPSRMADRARKADGAERNVEKWLREIYEFPTRARNQIETYRSARGREAIERALRESPERFGELRSDKRRLLVLRDTTEAQWKAGSYAGWLGGAFAAIEARPTRADHESAKEAAWAGQQKVDSARRAREALGSESASKVAHDAALTLQFAAQGNPERARRLNRQLAAMLPASTVQLARKAILLAEGPSDTGQSRGVRRGGYDVN